MTRTIFSIVAAAIIAGCCPHAVNTEEHDAAHSLVKPDDVLAQVNITPDISIQFNGSPFTSTAKFDDFKRDAQTTSRQYNQRFYQFAPDEISLMSTGIYFVKERGESNSILPPDFTFLPPDFTFNEFRSNLVFRWEYLPGSTIYFAWVHSMSNRNSLYVSGWRDNLDTMFDLPSTNTFLVKANFWFGM